MLRPVPLAFGFYFGRNVNGVKVVKTSIFCLMLASFLSNRSFAGDETPALEVPVDSAEVVTVEAPKIHPSSGGPVIVGSGGSGGASKTPVSTLEQVIQADAAQQQKNNKENTEKAKATPWFQNLLKHLLTLARRQLGFGMTYREKTLNSDGSETTVELCISGGAGAGDVELPDCTKYIVTPHEIQFAGEPNLLVEGQWRVSVIPVTAKCFRPDGRMVCLPKESLSWVVSSPTDLVDIWNQ